MGTCNSKDHLHQLFHNNFFLYMGMLMLVLLHPPPPQNRELLMDMYVANDARGPNTRRVHPNNEVHPGDGIKHEFRFETDIPWDDFKDHICANLGSITANACLVYKLTERNHGPPTQLANDGDWRRAMIKVVNLASCVRTKAVGIEVIDTNKRGKEKQNSNEYDDPNLEDPGILKAFKQLEEHL
ncbi:hypothetical protein BDQ17DRAFT_1437056 [Cyathus striatus]|nr:hypothetical protein BDQ17DRAFT_1437056 [Cyathus striatus]